MQYGFSFLGPGQGYGVNGRWVTGNYNPYDYSPNAIFSPFSLGTHNAGHPLMAGVTALNSDFENIVTPASGATEVAQDNVGVSLVAYRPVSGGHTTVGVTAYVGFDATQSGDWGKVIVNAGNWLLGGGGCGSPTPTPTPTGSPTCTPSGSKIYNIAGFNLGGQSTTTSIYDIPTNTWTTGAPIPEANGLSDHATGYWNGKIYVAGGFNGTGATNAARAYDIASNTWTSIAPLPAALYLPGFGVINGKFYVASGNNGTTEVNTLYIYDTATNTWTTGPVVPTPVTAPGSAVYQGKLYLFGGGAPFPTTITTTQIYDPVANSWSTGPSMNVGRVWFYGGAIDDTSLVAPGGDNPPGIEINDNEQLTASWAIKAPLPFVSRGPFAVSDGTFVYIGGGYDGSTVHADLLRYDPVANTYTPLAPSTDAHFLSQAVLVSSACGTPTPTPTASPSVTATPTAPATATPTASPSATPTCTAGGTPGPWTQAAPVTVDHYGGFMDSDGTVAYEGGGYSFSVGDNTNQFGKFNPSTNTWTPLAPVPDLINAEASGVYAPNVNKLFVFGGDSPNAGTVVNTTRIYDIATNTWSTGAPMPDVRAFMASGYFNGKIYLVGGYNTGNVDPSFGQVWEYDPVANTFNTSRMSMPATLGGPGFGIINGHMYVAGGRDLNNTNLNTLYDYNIATDSWTTGATMPSGVNVPGSAVIGGKLWVIGGGNPFTGPSTAPTSGEQGSKSMAQAGVHSGYDELSAGV